MLEFWQGIFYSAIADPIFAKVASILGVTKQVCKEYCTSGMMTYGGKYFLIVLVVIALLFVLKLLGFLNPGNYGGSATKKTANSPLAGKKLIFLGSSVTKGFAARGRSFVDMIAESTGASCVKEAVSGTTLVDNGERSYVARLKKLDKSQPCDLFICQLSTNDATKGSPLGKMAEGSQKDLEAALESYRKEQADTFSWYLSQNLPKVENAKFVVEGEWFMFLMAENADEGVETFKAAVKEMK